MICRRGPNVVLVWLISVSAMILFISADCRAERSSKGSKVIEAGAEEITEIIENQYEAGGIDRIRQELERHTDGESMELFGGYDAGRLIDDLVRGTVDMDLKGIGARTLKIFFRELYQNIGILAKITVLVVICALLKNFQTGFMSEGAGQIAFYVCYIVMISILLVSFGTVMKMGIGIIDRMVGFMYAIIPVMMALLISGGNITAGGILHPVMLLIVEASATIIRNVFVPLVFISAILTIVNNISEKIQLTRLVSLIRQIVSWSLGIILTIFIIAVSLQGSLGAVIDGATQKAAKFAISTFIPIVGKTLSDAADTVIGCTLMIRNAAGFAVMIGILLICVLPLIKIIALAGLFKVAGALLEPISDSRITNCINEIAGSMLHIFALSASVSFMFMVSVAALISAGNISAMLR
jgi:stage III sporulation protein AE